MNLRKGDIVWLVPLVDDLTMEPTAYRLWTDVPWHECDPVYDGRTAWVTPMEGTGPGLHVSVRRLYSKFSSALVAHRLQAMMRQVRLDD